MRFNLYQYKWLRIRLKGYTPNLMTKKQDDKIAKTLISANKKPIETVLLVNHLC